MDRLSVLALGASAAQREIVAYLAEFWLPAGLLAVVSGLRLAAPLWRALTRG